MQNWRLVFYLGSVPRVVTDKIQQNKIHLLKEQLFFMKEPRQMLMLILYWTMDSPDIFFFGQKALLETNENEWVWFLDPYPTVHHLPANSSNPSSSASNWQNIGIIRTKLT